MNTSQLIALFDQDQRIDVEYPDMRREVTPNVVRHINTSGAGEGMIIYSGLNETNADDVIREQVDYFESIGQDFEWKVYGHDKPPDLKDRLRSYGFTVEDVEAIMVLDLKEAPEILRHPVRHDVRRITDPGKISDVLSVKQQVWDEDFSWLGHYLAGALRDHPEQVSAYVAYVDGQPASSARIYFPGRSQFASLWGGATLSRFRKRGLYTALLAVRAQEAKTRQVRYLTVDASPMSRPILEKYGFELIAYSYPCKRRNLQHSTGLP
ncbi:MAG TPA: GNAT family N-acetyltransferase [Anaerolineales bacterium]